MAKRTNRKNIDNEEEMMDDSDDLSYEPDTPAEQIKQLKEKLEACKKERQEYLDGWQRTQADALNARKEHLEQVQKATQRGQEAVIGELLAVMDSFDAARNSEQWNTVDATWRDGMEQVYNQLEQVLKQFNVARFGAEGETFDPTLHEAVRAEGDNARTITRVVRSGWKMGDTVLRPAHVEVAGGGSE